MKTFKDPFLNKSADVHDNTPHRLVKASLKLAVTGMGSPTRLAPAWSDEDDLSEFDRKKSGAMTGKGARCLRSNIPVVGPDENYGGPMRF